MWASVGYLVYNTRHNCQNLVLLQVDLIWRVGTEGTEILGVFFVV